MATLGFPSDPDQIPMKNYAFNLYNKFLANPRAASKYTHIGRLDIATTTTKSVQIKQSVEQLRSNDTLSISHHPFIEYIEPDILKESVIVPYLDTEPIEGVTYRPKAGCLTPQEVAYEFIERAKDNGVEFRTNTPVTNITLSNGRVTGLQAENDQVEVDHVVCAAGPWNIKIARQIGLDLPVKHTLAPIIKLQPEQTITPTPPYIRHLEAGIYFRGDTDGSVYVGRNPDEHTPFEDAPEFDPNAIDETVPKDFREEATDVITTIFPSLVDADIVDEWVGIRSMTPDGNPIVGWTEIDGFSIAAFNSGGIQLSPGIGRIIAKQIVNQDPTDFYDSFSITRFEGYTDA